jgi:hypothetical protein
MKFVQHSRKEVFNIWKYLNRIKKVQIDLLGPIQTKEKIGIVYD